MNPNAWKSGRLPTVVSCGVQFTLRQKLKKSEFRLWWVSMMPFGMPVDPLEKSRTASFMLSRHVFGAYWHISMREGSRMASMIAVYLMLFVMYGRMSSSRNISGVGLSFSLSRNFRLVRMSLIPAFSMDACRTASPTE